MVSTPNVTLKGNIIFDEGAQRSFITQDLATKLNLQPYGKDNICLGSFGAKSSYKNLDMGIVEIHTLSGDKIPISVLVVTRIAPPIQNSIRMSLMHLPHIMAIKLDHPVTEDEIPILIGADYYWTFIEDQVIRGKGPTAAASKFVWVTTWCILTDFHCYSFPCVCTMSAEVTSIEQFWNIESAGTQPSMEDADKQFLELYMKNSITCQQDGSYSLKFPWKDNHLPLPTNYNVCHRRTRLLARRLAQTLETLKIYGNIISEQLTQGFLEQLQSTSTTDAHYIPHHPVKKESSKTPI